MASRKILDWLGYELMRLGHMMQAGVSYENATAMRAGRTQEDFNKDLRVGVNSALVGQAGLAQILIEKGVFTEEEYMEAQVAAMEREVNSYEIRINESLGADSKVTLSTFYEKRPRPKDDEE